MESNENLGNENSKWRSRRARHEKPCSWRKILAGTLGTFVSIAAIAGGVFGWFQYRSDNESISLIKDSSALGVTFDLSVKELQDEGLFRTVELKLKLSNGGDKVVLQPTLEYPNEIEASPEEGFGSPSCIATYSYKREGGTHSLTPLTLEDIAPGETKEITFTSPTLIDGNIYESKEQFAEIFTLRFKDAHGSIWETKRGSIEKIDEEYPTSGICHKTVQFTNS